jgi:hypothetical protein
VAVPVVKVNTEVELKAAKCIFLTRLTHPELTSTQAIEDQALKYMDLEIPALHVRIAIAFVRAAQA